MENRFLFLALTLIPGLNSIAACRLFKRFGSPERIFQAAHSDLLQVEGISQELAGRIISFDIEKALKKEQERMALHETTFITIEDEIYPELLRHIFDPPLVLFIKGGFLQEDRNSIAIVGSRRPTLYGKFVAQDMASQLISKNITVVSGMARGVDTMAHKGALRSQGRTIAVLGCGVDYIYPPENKSLMEEISKNGAVLSEFPMGTGPYKQNFPMRNRIISGITLGTLVVEAGVQSGALITAKQALEQGREVFAVPGPINSWASKGTNGLIKQGAKLVESIEDILEEIGPQIQFIHRQGKLEGKETISSGQEGTVKNADSVLESLDEGPQHIDTLIEKTGLPAQEIISRLIKMEMEGIIRQMPGKMYAKV